MTWVLGDEIMPEGFSARQDGSIPGDGMTYAGTIRRVKKALKMSGFGGSEDKACCDDSNADQNPCPSCKSCCDHLGSDPDCCNCNTFTYATRQSTEDELWRQTLQDNDDFWRKQLDLKDEVIANINSSVSQLVDDCNHWFDQYVAVSTQLFQCQAELSKTKDGLAQARAISGVSPEDVKATSKAYINLLEHATDLERELSALRLRQMDGFADRFWQQALDGREEVIGKLDAENKQLADENQKLRENYNELVLKRKVNQERYQNGQPCILNGHVCGFVTELQERNDNQARAIRELTDALPEFQYDETAGTFPADAILTTDGYETLKPACQSCLKGDEPTCGCGLFDKKPALKPIPHDDCVGGIDHCWQCIRMSGECCGCGRYFPKTEFDYSTL